MPEDDAENARAALRALWAMSGQMDSADRLGQEDEGCAPTHIKPQADAIGTTFQAHASDPSSEVSFAQFAEENEPTFDRGEAANKFREAFKSQLAMDGKLGKYGGRSVADAAKETTRKAVGKPTEE